MILLFTDFGASGPYLGQMRAVLAQYAPGVPVIDMLSCIAPGSLDTSLSHAAGLSDIAVCHA